MRYTKGNFYTCLSLCFIGTYWLFCRNFSSEVLYYQFLALTGQVFLELLPYLECCTWEVVESILLPSGTIIFFFFALDETFLHLANYDQIMMTILLCCKANAHLMITRYLGPHLLGLPMVMLQCCPRVFSCLLLLMP